MSTSSCRHSAEIRNPEKQKKPAPYSDTEPAMTENSIEFI